MTKRLMINILIIVLAFGGYFLFDEMSKKNIKVSEIEIGDITSSTFYKGKIIPREIIPIYIEAPVLIESVITRMGQEVERGDKLLIFSSKSIAENIKELKMNGMDIKNIKIQIANLNNGLSNLKLDSKKFEIKNLEEEIKGDERKLSTLATEVKVLKEKVKVYKKLLTIDSVSSTETNKIINECEKKENELEDLKTKLELNKQKFKLSQASFEILARELQYEKMKLKSDLQKLELNREILTRRSEQLKKPLEAPVNGTIVMIDVSEGSNVLEGRRLLAISPRSENIIKIEIPLYKAINLRKNQKVIIKSLTFDKKLMYIGVIQHFSNLVRKNALGKEESIVEMEIKTFEKTHLKLGTVVSVEIEDKCAKNILKIKSVSVMEIGEKAFVFVVDNGRVYRTEIKIGLRTNEEFEVLNLLRGTKIVMNPYEVKNGEKIKIIK